MPIRYSSSDLIKLLETDGWILVRIKGSHHHFKHPRKNGIVTVVHPEKNTPQGTALNILRQAGLR